MRFWRDNGLTIVLLLLFTGSILGQWIAGWHVAIEDATRHHQPALSLAAYAVSPQFLSSVFENWEREFLLMSAYVILTAMLFQRGSAESKDLDEPARDSGLAKPRQPMRKLRPSLVGGRCGDPVRSFAGLALALPFLISRHPLDAKRENGSAGTAGERRGPARPDRLSG
ncbi:MAG TPA: DUF6766 family protein [Novosphingobium sp.]